MSAFADTNWLESLYIKPCTGNKEAEERHRIVERRTRKQSGPLVISHIVLLEARNVFGRVTGVPKPVEWEDLLADFNGRVISIVPRERLVIRAGVSDKGITRKHAEVIAFAKDVAERLQIVGAANIQCKFDGRELRLIEVNPRFSGGIPLTIASGADFASWLVQMAGGIELRPRIGKFEDGLAMMSFEESIFAHEDNLKLRHTEKPRMLSRTRAAYVN